MPRDLSIFSWNRRFLTSCLLTSNVVNASVTSPLGMICGMLVVSLC